MLKRSAIPDPVLIMRFAAAFLVLIGLVVLLFLNPLIVEDKYIGVRSCRGCDDLVDVAIVWNKFCFWQTDILLFTLNAATEKPRTDRKTNLATKDAMALIDCEHAESVPTGFNAEAWVIYVVFSLYPWEEKIFVVTTFVQRDDVRRFRQNFDLPVQFDNHAIFVS